MSCFILPKAWGTKRCEPQFYRSGAQTDSVICQGHSCEAVTWTPSTDTQSPPPTEICCGFPSQRAPDMPSGLTLESVSPGSLPRATPTPGWEIRAKPRGLREEDDRKLLAHRVNGWALGVPKHQALELCDLRQGPSRLCSLHSPGGLLGCLRASMVCRTPGTELVPWLHSECEPVTPWPAGSL